MLGNQWIAQFPSTLRLLLGHNSRGLDRCERFQSIAPVGAQASGGPLDEELELAHGGTADVEHGPAGGQQDRGGDQDEP